MEVEMDVMQELEDRNLVVRARIPVPHPSIVVAGMVAGVIAVFPFVVGMVPGQAAPTTGLVDLGLLTAGLFLLVVYRGRGLDRIEPE